MKECVSKPPIKIFPQKSTTQSATADKSLYNLSCIYVQRGVLWVLDDVNTLGPAWCCIVVLSFRTALTQMQNSQEKL